MSYIFLPPLFGYSHALYNLYIPFWYIARYYHTSLLPLTNRVALNSMQNYRPKCYSTR